MNKYIIALGMTLPVVSCNNNGKHLEANLKDTISHKKVPIHVKTDSCDWELYTIKPLNTINPEKNTISHPVVIKCFYLEKSLNKYMGQKDHSIGKPDKFKDASFEYIRQIFYLTQTQCAYFEDMLEPMFDTLNINVVDIHFDDSVLNFKTKDGYYSIGKSHFKENDGVILYKPDKKPVLWTDKIHCNNENFILNYFK